VNNIVQSRDSAVSQADFTYIAHPSGVMPIKARVEQRQNGDWHVEYATVVQSARRLMEGYVCVPSSVLDDQ
jgi:2-methylaconitate cis-trans-isomerase PrpF